MRIPRPPHIAPQAEGGLQAGPGGLHLCWPDNAPFIPQSSSGTGTRWLPAPRDGGGTGDGGSVPTVSAPRPREAVPRARGGRAQQHPLGDAPGSAPHLGDDALRGFSLWGRCLTPPPQKRSPCSLHPSLLAASQLTGSSEPSLWDPLPKPSARDDDGAVGATALSRSRGCISQGPRGPAATPEGHPGGPEAWQTFPQHLGDHSRPPRPAVGQNQRGTARKPPSPAPGCPADPYPPPALPITHSLPEPPALPEAPRHAAPPTPGHSPEHPSLPYGAISSRSPPATESPAVPPTGERPKKAPARGFAPMIDPPRACPPLLEPALALVLLRYCPAQGWSGGRLPF